MTSYSSERLTAARRALNRRSWEIWETLQVSDRVRFEATEDVITFCGTSIGALRQIFPEHMEVLSSRWGETIWTSGDYSEDGMKAAIRSVLQIGEALAPVDDLPGALGMYLINEMLRRFEGRLGFESLDPVAYESRRIHINRVASSYLHPWIHMDLLIVAEEISDADLRRDEQLVADRRARLARTVLAKPTDHSDLHGYFLGRYLRGFWAQRASTGLLEAIVSELRYWRFFEAEAALWRELLSRAPMENGWGEYADLLLRLGFRCEALRHHVSHAEAPHTAYLASGLEILTDVMTMGLLGAWQFDSSMALIEETRSVILAAKATSEWRADPELLAEALAAREIPPVELVVQLWENGDTVAAVCATIAPLSRCSSSQELLAVVSRGLSSVRFVTVQELHPLVSRSLLFPLNEALHQAASHPGIMNLEDLEQLNDVVNILIKSHPGLLSTNSDDRMGLMMEGAPTNW